MYYKLKYSSLLFLEKKHNSVIYIKGPLGKNYVKVPSNVRFLLDHSKNIIIFYLQLEKGKKSKLSGFLSIFLNICRTLVFGDLVGLNIQGLGLKFLKINNFAQKGQYLSMSLGYSDPVHHRIDITRFLFFFINNRNIFTYGIDYSFFRNEIYTLLGLKKPDKFRKRENGITINKIIR